MRPGREGERVSGPAEQDEQDPVRTLLTVIDLCLCPMPRSETQPPLVVIMDDDPSIRRALDRLLRAAGLSVETFASAAELFARESPVRPMCLVLDIHLPDMNGLDVLKGIIAADQGVPVLIITGETDPELREKALRAGASAFLSKPFDDDQLLKEIHRVLLL
jgi:FixJ family two-component response regulator